MHTLLQINTVCNSGSTGRIAEEIGLLAMQNGWKSYIAYGRGNPVSQSVVYKICGNWDLYFNAAIARIYDNDGFCRKGATERLIKYIQKVNPDVIHLHNLHGYYLNLRLLFTYLFDANIHIVWTLHDCWAFTGHCTHFEYVECIHWQLECYNCREKGNYPASVLLDRSRINFRIKKKIITKLQKLVIVTPSQWLAKLTQLSLLKDYPVHIINNGIDLKSFYPRETINLAQKYGIVGKNIVLGVAGNWTERKGLRCLVELSFRLGNDYKVIVVGVTRKQMQQLPSSVIGIQHTEGIAELSILYSLADVYVNPTLEDTFPTTNIEAIACGTPVITYRTGGSPEAIDEKTGMVVEQGDIDGVIKAVETIIKKGKSFYFANCRKRAEERFDKDKQFRKYFELYRSVLKK